MKKIAVLLLLGTFCLVGCQQAQQGKIGYIDNSVLKDNYNELKKSNEKFEARRNKLDSSMQLVAQKFQAKVQDFQEHFEEMSEDDQEKQRNALMQEQNQLQQQNQAQQNALMQDNQKEQDSLDEIIKKAVEDYAKSNNYTFVFGDNDGENVMYAKASQDITKAILKKLNAGESTDDNAAKSDKK